MGGSRSPAMRPTMIAPKCPFTAEQQLNNELDNTNPSTATTTTKTLSPHLPGHPRVKLRNQKSLWHFLEREFCSTDLERMASKLWWMSKQDGRSISALHRQGVKKRTIIVTEDPKLHLVWIHDRIFIKPLPEYLLSHAFWETYLGCKDDANNNGNGNNISNNNSNNSTSAGKEGSGILIEGANGDLEDANLRLRRTRIRQHALGYLRTYFYLIKHESDFRVAQRPYLCLVPQRVSWKQFCDFSERFDEIRDADVAERYRYGEIRLTRLNLYAKLLLRRWYFHRLHSQYGSYFGRFYGPFLFLFGVLSVCLSAMQVEASVEQVDILGEQWPAFLKAARWFSVVSIFFVIILVLLLAWLWLYKIVQEWRFAIKDRFFRPKAGV